LSLINQKLNSDGQGVINSILYTLAANSSTYSSAFHDVTIGNNKCTAGSTYCSSAGASEYSAGTGYDQASGLGSVDFYNLLMAWPNSNSSTVPSSTTLAAATTTPSSGESDTVTITVASASSSVSTIPTGTLTILVDGTTVSSDLALADGSATYLFSSDVAGSHTVTASYSGDSTFASSNGSLSLTVGGEKTFTLSGTNVTVSAGSSSGSTITVTPKNGYTGTIAFTVSSSPSLTNGCFSLANATVSGSSAVTASLTVSTSSSACASASIRRAPERTGLAPGFRSRRNFRPYDACGILLLWAAILSSLVRHRQSRRPTLAGAVLLLAGAAFAAAGCSSTTSSTHNASKGTYTVTIVGSDVATPSITATTTIRVTVD
jgi:hypothetical protein